MARELGPRERTAVELRFMQNVFGVDGVTCATAAPKMTSPTAFIVEINSRAIAVWLFSSRFRRPCQCGDVWKMETVLDGWFIYSRCMPADPTKTVKYMRIRGPTDP